MTALPTNETDRKDALGSVTISTPLLTPVRPDTGRRLDLSKQYSVEAIKAELNKANMGLSTASLRSLSTALAVSFAGPSIAQSATTGQSLAPDGTVTTTDESTRTVSQQTPEVPGVPSAEQPNEKALEALFGLLSRSGTDYQLPVGETMSLVASLHAYGVALEEFYNYDYFNQVVDSNRVYVLQLQRERTRLAQELSDVDLRRARLFQEAAGDFPELSSGFTALAASPEGDPEAVFSQFNQGLVKQFKDRFADRLFTLDVEESQTQQEIKKVEAELDQHKTMLVPYRMTFRVSAAPGWFSQQNQLDAVADIKLTSASGINCQFAGAVPAETTQTLDEFAASLRQLSNALEVGGAYGPVAAKATVQRLAAKAERLEGLRSNTTFIAEYPGDGDTLRLRFSPSVVANASRRMLDRVGINVTALVLVEVPVTTGVPPLRLPEELKAEVKYHFEPSLRLVGGGKYRGPKSRTRRSQLGLPDSIPVVNKTVSLPPFAPDDRIGQLAFVDGGTQSATWIVNSGDKSHTAKALVTTRLVALSAEDEIKLTLMGNMGAPTIRSGAESLVGSGPFTVRPGNDIVIMFDVPASAIKPGKDGALPTISPFPVVLFATSGERSIAQTVKVGASSGGSGGSGGSSGSTPPKKDDKPVLTYERAGVKINIPVDQLTPELAEVLKSTFKDLTIVVPGLTAQPAKPTDTPDTGGAGGSSGSSGGGG